MITQSDALLLNPEGTGDRKSAIRATSVRVHRAVPSEARHGAEPIDALLTVFGIVSRRTVAGLVAGERYPCFRDAPDRDRNVHRPPLSSIRSKGSFSLFGFKAASTGLVVSAMSNDESPTFPTWPVVPPLRSPMDPPPPPVEMDVEFAARSRRGARHAANHDHYLILRLGRSQETLMTNLPAGDVRKRFDECGYAMVIADGVGDAGESASRIAVATLAQLGTQFGKWNLRIDEPVAEEVMDRGERFYRAIDSTLRQATPKVLHDRQTTLTAVYTAGTELFFAHVGNSRAYMFRDGELMQLTHDGISDAPPPVRRLGVDRSRIPRRLMTDTLGGPGSGPPRIDIERCGLLDGDLLLLCSSGLTSAAEDPAIAAALSAFGTPDEQARALIDLADQAGGTEDATVLVGHYNSRP